MSSEITTFQDHARVLPALSDALWRCSVAVESGQGLSHHFGRVWLKKLFLQQKERKIQLATWNIGTLTGKKIKFVVVMKRRVSVACLQETKWKGDKAKELTDGYKLFFIEETTI